MNETMAENNGSGCREITLEGKTLKRVVARYPDGDRLDVQNGREGEVVLTLVPPFQERVPHYPEVAQALAPLFVVDERDEGSERRVELSPRRNRIQRFSYVQAIIPADRRLQVEAGFEGNPFSVRLSVR